jgi:hypothetical protein
VNDGSPASVLLDGRPALPGGLHMYRALLLALALTLSANYQVLAQRGNVEEAINVVVLFCVAGGERVEITGTTSDDKGVEVRKNTGTGNTSISISRSSARGLVDGIIGQMNKVSADQASEARRCMQPYIERIISLLLGGPAPTTPSLPVSSLWSHNNSTMSVTTQENRLTIYYEQPRQGMIDEGVRRGTVLFDGQRTGNKLSGTSWVFDRRCGKIPYADDGEVLSGERSIYLRGRHVPTQLGPNCEPLAYRIDPSIIDRQE